MADDNTWRIRHRGFIKSQGGRDCYVFIKRWGGRSFYYVIPVEKFWGVDSPP